MDQSTLEYYDKNADAYFKKTSLIDMSHFHRRFVSLCSKGSRILDIGCGCGRDLKEFKKQGFIPIGLEPSLSLKSLASLHSGCNVVQGDASYIPFSDESFDALWCCAVFVHLSQEEIEQTLHEILRVSKQGTTIFFSLKKGKGFLRTEDNRLFYFYEEAEIEKILQAFPFGFRIYEESTSQDGTNWLNIFIRVDDNQKKQRCKISLSQAASWGQMLLKKADIEDSRMEAEWLLEHCTKNDRLELYNNPEKPLTKAQEKYFFLCIKKRSSHCPFAYITGKSYFMEFTFAVNRHVLIPRPETELMIEYAMKMFPKNKPFLALDIGTGSGCIAISLLKYFSDAYIIATDISSKALKVAWKNACSLQVQERLLLCKANLFPPFVPGPVFDYILSNPPYISEKDYQNLMPEVKNFEPSTALIAGDGLDFYRKIFSQALIFLKKSGLLIVEIGYGQMESIRNLAKDRLRIREILQDLAGIDRIIVMEKIN